MTTIIGKLLNINAFKRAFCKVMNKEKISYEELHAYAEQFEEVIPHI
jgi:hypothetical protein